MHSINETAKEAHQSVALGDGGNCSIWNASLSIWHKPPLVGQELRHYQGHFITEESTMKLIMSNGIRSLVHGKQVMHKLYTEN